LIVLYRRSLEDAVTAGRADAKNFPSRNRITLLSRTLHRVRGAQPQAHQSRHQIRAAHPGAGASAESQARAARGRRV